MHSDADIQERLSSIETRLAKLEAVSPQEPSQMMDPNEIRLRLKAAFRLREIGAADQRTLDAIKTFEVLVSRHQIPRS